MTFREHVEFAAWVLRRLAVPAYVLLVDTKTRYRQPAAGRLDVLLLMSEPGKLCWGASLDLVPMGSPEP